MKITYINHSSFSVELESCILIFDYFKGNLPKFDNNKKIYVFSSHSHNDHFNEVIYKLEEEYKDVTYILSNDIKKANLKKVWYIEADEKILVDDLTISTLDSTDIGVAFMINIEGINIYHAGDLNLWHWEGENTDKENEEAKNMFLKEMNKIKDYKFDIAFVPLDPRQGKQFCLGFDRFMKTTNTKTVFPMHCWDDYSVIGKLLDLEICKEYKDKIIKIYKENQEITI